MFPKRRPRKLRKYTVDDDCNADDANDVCDPIHGAAAPAAPTHESNAIHTFTATDTCIDTDLRASTLEVLASEVEQMHRRERREENETGALQSQDQGQGQVQVQAQIYNAYELEQMHTNARFGRTPGSGDDHKELYYHSSVPATPEFDGKRHRQHHNRNNNIIHVKDDDGIGTYATHAKDGMASMTNQAHKELREEVGDEEQEDEEDALAWEYEIMKRAGRSTDACTEARQRVYSELRATATQYIGHTQTQTEEVSVSETQQKICDILTYHQAQFTHSNAQIHLYQQQQARMRSNLETMYDDLKAATERAEWVQNQWYPYVNNLLLMVGERSGLIDKAARLAVDRQMESVAVSRIRLRLLESDEDGVEESNVREILQAMGFGVQSKTQFISKARDGKNEAEDENGNGLPEKNVDIAALMGDINPQYSNFAEIVKRFALWKSKYPSDFEQANAIVALARIATFFANIELCSFNWSSTRRMYSTASWRAGSQLKFQGDEMHTLVGHVFFRSRYAEAFFLSTWDLVNWKVHDSVQAFCNELDLILEDTSLMVNKIPLYEKKLDELFINHVLASFCDQARYKLVSKKHLDDLNAWLQDLLCLVSRASLLLDCLVKHKLSHSKLIDGWMRFVKERVVHAFILGRLVDAIDHHPNMPAMIEAKIAWLDKVMTSHEMREWCQHASLQEFDGWNMLLARLDLQAHTIKDPRLLEVWRAMLTR